MPFGTFSVSRLILLYNTHCEIVEIFEQLERIILDVRVNPVKGNSMRKLKRLLLWLWAHTIGCLRIDRKINLVTLSAVVVACLAFNVQQADLQHRTTLLAAQNEDLKKTQTELKEAQAKIQKHTEDLNSQVVKLNQHREVLLIHNEGLESQFKQTQNQYDHLKRIYESLDAGHLNRSIANDALLKLQFAANISLYSSTSLIATSLANNPLASGDERLLFGTIKQICDLCLQQTLDGFAFIEDGAKLNAAFEQSLNGLAEQQREVVRKNRPDRDRVNADFKAKGDAVFEKIKTLEAKQKELVERISSEHKKNMMSPSK